jgi:hypothetical protein
VPPVGKDDSTASALHAMGLTDSFIAERFKQVHETPQVDDTIDLLAIIAQEFDFLLLHCLDLTTPNGFNWSGVKIKLEMLQIPLNKKYLVFAIEAFNVWMLTQNVS